MRFHAVHIGLSQASVVGATLLVAALTFAACYTDYGLTYSDYDVVVTRYAGETDFGAFKTFFMPDTVFIVGDSTSKITGEYDELILTSVASNFESRGYVRITDPLSPTPPDFAVQVGKSTSTTVVLYGGGYWGGWYPWYGYGYGWGYYPYYPYYGASSYSQGSVFATMIDPARTDTVAKLIGTVWFGGVNGLLGDVSKGGRDRIYNSINQMFTQSPYLGSDR